MPQNTRRVPPRGSKEREAHGGKARSSKGRPIEETSAGWPLRQQEAPEPAAPLYAPDPTVVDAAGDDRARPEQPSTGEDAARPD